jgi:putative addiction module CopG family antidote
MELRITPTHEQETFIRDGIASGRFQSAEDAARIALRYWETYERRRAELLVDLEAGEASLARGQGISLDTPEAISRFFEEVNRRNRAKASR